MGQKEVVQAELERELVRRGSCLASWEKQEEIARWCQEHKIKQDERGWHFTAQDIKDRDTALAGYDSTIKKLRIEIAEFDKAILTAIEKWSA